MMNYAQKHHQSMVSTLYCPVLNNLQSPFEAETEAYDGALPPVIGEERKPSFSDKAIHGKGEFPILQSQGQPQFMGYFPNILVIERRKGMLCLAAFIKGDDI